MDIKNLKKRKNEIEYTQTDIAQELKQINQKLEIKAIGDTVDLLLEYQEKIGKLDTITLVTYLNSLATDIKDIHNK